MSEHTPGPWEVDAEDSHKVTSEDYGAIAWTPNEPAEMPTIVAEMRANARLIAAAPKMLATLKLAEWTFRVPAGERDEVAALAAIRDAITEATGRPA